MLRYMVDNLSDVEKIRELRKHQDAEWKPLGIPPGCALQEDIDITYEKEKSQLM